MFRHIVLFSFHDGVDVDAIVAGLDALVGVVPGMISMRAGSDAGISEGNFDFAAVVDFEDEAAWHGYVSHPAHVKVRDELIRPFSTARAAVQMNVDA